MRMPTQHSLLRLASFAAVALAAPVGVPVLANTQAQPPVCFTNRFGVEQCDINNQPGTQTTSAALRNGSAEKAQARLKRYCDDRGKAGKIDADGVCTAPINGN